MGDALMGFFGATPGFRARQLESAWMISTGEPVLDLNCATIDDGAPEGTLESFHGELYERDVPFLICLSGSVATELAPVANRLGLRYAGPSTVMCYVPDLLDLHEGPIGFGMGRVGDRADLEACGELAAQIFGLPIESVRNIFKPQLLANPGIAVYLALLDGEPAGSVVLSLHEREVGIWCMGTAAACRRRGVGSALLLNAMREHWFPGRRYFLLPTPEGLPLYQRIGFRTSTTGQAWTGNL
jgi:GNAT superfamily N-acetyltransferase